MSPTAGHAAPRTSDDASPAVPPVVHALLDKRCSQGNFDACKRLRSWVFPSLARDASRAALVTRYDGECRARSKYACGHLAALTASSDQAMSLAQKACKRGDVHGCYMLAGLLRDRFGRDGVDRERARKLWKQAVEASRKVCKRGHELGCGLLADLHKRGAPGQADDAKRAASEMRSLCRKGSASACRNQLRLECGPGGIKPNSSDCRPKPRAITVALDSDGVEGGVFGGLGGSSLSGSPFSKTRYVSSHYVEAHRKAGKRVIPPDRTDRRFMRKARVKSVSASFEMCLHASGRVRSVKLVRKTGYYRYDRKIAREVKKTWRFRPIRFGGKPAAVCTRVSHKYRVGKK